MGDDVQRSLGEISGKLDSLINTMREHAQEDTRRFGEVGKLLMQHSEEINQAKGAKSALMWAGGLVAALVSAAVAEAHRLFSR